MTEEKHIHFDEAKKFVIEKGYCKCSELQVQFKIGYNSGGRLVDQLYENGIISDFEGSKKREVFIKLPKPITDYHYSMEYLSKLIGKNISEEKGESNITTFTIVSVVAIENELNTNKIKKISFSTNREFIILFDSLSIMALIEGEYEILGFGSSAIKLKVIP